MAGDAGQGGEGKRFGREHQSEVTSRAPAGKRAGVRWQGKHRPDSWLRNETSIVNLSVGHDIHMRRERWTKIFEFS
jgi:hypothetical protein